ncbi:hypothetical protein EK21DRAFT_109862 [Setomelanomma holmii]|uniref:Uncharacterized protein n=1 Tax=Setomelanomma holmii TaxID=210430 RepID=A0A9P4HD91_9PLEO|nr:hypothetical protein EK21DRAFT_109862 [Setomelanomma holmii]
MARGRAVFACALAIHVAYVAAAYDRLYYASNSTKFFCTSGFGLSCTPPSVCAHDDLINKYYCCNPGDPKAVCYTGMDVDCKGANNAASGAQDKCTPGSTGFCCLKNTEQCTQTTNQINICWATQENPVANLSKALSNQAYSSLSSARPSATSYSININALLGSSTSSSAASSPTASISATASSSSSATPTNNSSSGLSGGAIGGIVGGVVGGLALLGAIGFFLWRRKKNAKNAASAYEAPYTSNGYQPAATEAPAGTYMAEAPATEKYAHRGGEVGHGGAGYTEPVELSGNAPVELPGNARQY